MNKYLTLYPNHWNVHTLNLKRQGFLLDRIVGLSQWEGNICLFILGWGGGGRFLKNFMLLLCVGWVFWFGLSYLCKKNTYCINHSSGRTIKNLNSFLIEHDLATALSLVLHLIYECCLVLLVTCFSGVLYIKWN